MKNAEPPHCTMDPDADGQLRLSGSWTLSTALQSAQVLGGIHAQVRDMDARGIDQLEEGADAPADLGQLQHPTLAITIENPGLDPREPLRYQSLVELSAAHLDQVLEDYFRQSEQLPSRLLLAADGDRACGLMLQKLPDDEDDLDG